MSPRPGSKLFGLALAVVLWPAFSAATHATGTLEEGLTDLAKEIKSALDKERIDAVALGAFNGPADLPSSFGPSMKSFLTTHLKNAGVSVKDGANYEIKGDYRAVVDQDKAGIKIVAQLLDPNLNQLVQFPGQTIYDREEVIKFSGATFGKKTGAGDPLANSLKKPNVFLSQSIVRPTADSPYAVEILVKTANGYVPRAAKTVNGLAFVDLKRGEVFAVRVINASAEEVAMGLHVDGLNMFARSKEMHPATGKPFQHLIYQPKSEQFLVKGWYMNNQVTEEFKLVPFKHGHAVFLGETKGVGTITVTFAKCSPLPAATKGINSPQNAVGSGEQINQTYAATEREVGEIVASITVRYQK